MINEIPTYEELLQRCLDRIPSTLDKRQGSVIYNALAPCCAELEQLWIKLASTYELVFVDTAVGEALDALVKQNGMTRKEATYALRKGEFNMVVPVGSRFSDGNLSYIVVENIPGTNNSRLECETAGSVGNTYYGSLIPISYIDGLTSAELTDIIDSGEDIETDDALRERYLEWVTAPEFGGNISDYQVKVKALTGVGGCKVIPVWDGGGTVKLIISNSTYGVPDKSLIDYVQQEVDPTGDQKGLGIAPIGHVVTVVGAEAASLTVACELVLETGKTIANVQTLIDDVVKNYFTYLASTWDSNENLIIRISQIETRILGVTGVLDINSLTVNGTTNNIQLTSTQIPVLNGSVDISV